MTDKDSSNYFVLRSSRLAVEVARPGAVYRGTRFDWTGFITQVTLDGVHTFCVPENYLEGVGSGGIGLCNEFGIDMPVGYDEAAPGEAFPKLGVGLLRRRDQQPYSFGFPYEIVQPFPIRVEAFANGAVFMVDPVDCRGFAVRMVKTLRVVDNELTISCRVENAGSRSVETLEYCHNFVGFSQQPVGEDYVLKLPAEIKYENPASNAQGVLRRIFNRFLPGLDQATRNLKIMGREITFRKADNISFYLRPLGLWATSLPQWELTHRSLGITMREYDDFCPVRVAIWGAAHVISPEIFVGIHLEPGQSLAWTRRYTFDLQS